MNTPRTSPLAVSHDADSVFRRRLLVIVALGLLCRFAMAIYAERRPAIFDFPDTHRYLAVARHIAAGRGPIETEALRASTDPLYPALLSVGCLAGMESDNQLLRFGRILNTIAGLLSIVLLANVGRRLISYRAGLLAGLILAIDPIMVFFNTLVLTETWYVMLVLAASLAIASARQSRSLWHVGMAGVVFGLSILTRSSGLLLPLFFVPLIWKVGTRVPRRPAAVAVFLPALFVMLVPTMARNYRLFGTIVPVRTGNGASLLEALGPWADGSPGMDRIQYPTFPPNANEYERDRLCRDAAVDWAREHPVQAVSLAISKLRRTWSITMNAANYSSWFYTTVAWLSVAPVFAIALAGAWQLRHRPWILSFLLLPAAYFSLVHAIFVGSVRYRIPVMPFLFVLAGVAIDRLWQRTSPSRTIHAEDPQRA